LNLLQTVPEFIWFVLSFWQAYVTGGILIAIMSIWERYHKRSISWNKFRWIFIVFLFVSFFNAWHDQKNIATRAQETVKKNNESLISQKTVFENEIAKLNANLNDATNNLNVSSPAFQNAIGVLRSFMSYRRSIGPSTPCMILTTSTQDSRAIDQTVIGLAVPGSNCSNGDLQNIGVKPWDIDKESIKGLVFGKLVLHALPETKGADRLVDDLSNFIQTTRSYEIPKLLKPSQNIIWLQFGEGTKWNTQLH
jgi:hypothetical protein